MAAPKQGTRKRILDSAEYLFARNGYDNTTFRSIAKRAKCTVGSANYHFGSKKNLFYCVSERRFKALMDARYAAYKKATAGSNGQLSLEEVLECITKPILEFSFRGDAGWRSYIRILSRILSDKVLYDSGFAEESEAAARELIEWIKQAAPEADEKDIGYAYQFMIASMIQCCADIYVNRVSRITSGVCDASDYAEVEQRILNYIYAGFSAVIRFP